MTDQELESLLSSLDAPEFACGHQTRLRVRLGRRGVSTELERFSARDVVATRRDERHHRQVRPVGAWSALAAMLLLAAALAVRLPSSQPREQAPPASAQPRWAVAAEPLIIRTDLFASRRVEPFIDIRRWSTYSGASR